MWEVQARNGRWAVVLGDMVDSAYWHTEGSAQIRASALNAKRMPQLAATELADAPAEGEPFYAVLCVMDYGAPDGRVFDKFDWAPVPLPFMALDSNEGGGHYGAQLAGKLETIEVLEDGRRVFATGHLGTTDTANETAQQIRDQSLRFVSVDPADYEVEEEVTKITSTGIPLEGRARFTSYTIGGATACPFPAIRQAVVWLDGMDAPAELTDALPDPPTHDAPEVVEVGDDFFMPFFESRMKASGSPAPEYEDSPILADNPEAMELLAASAPARKSCTLTDDCGGPALAPAAWFAETPLSKPTPFTVEADGRFYGHLALWDTPHRGFLHYTQTDNVYAPRGDDFANFNLASLPVACCADAGCGHKRQTVRTGPLVLGTTHAPKGRLSAREVQRFYEDTGFVVGDVHAYADQWGIAVAGGLRPGVDDKRVRELLGSAGSGDWRYIDGSLRLCGILCVNSPGFALVASSIAVMDGEAVSAFAGFGQVTSQASADELVASSAARTTSLVTEARALSSALLAIQPGPTAAEIADALGTKYALVDRATFDRLSQEFDWLRPLVVEQQEALLGAE